MPPTDAAVAASPAPSPPATHRAAAPHATQAADATGLPRRALPFSAKQPSRAAQTHFAEAAHHGTAPRTNSNTGSGGSRKGYTDPALGHSGLSRGTFGGASCNPLPGRLTCGLAAAHAETGHTKPRLPGQPSH